MEVINKTEEAMLAIPKSVRQVMFVGWNVSDGMNKRFDVRYAGLDRQLSLKVESTVKFRVMDNGTILLLSPAVGADIPAVLHVNKPGSSTRRFTVPRITGDNLHEEEFIDFISDDNESCYVLSRFRNEDGPRNRFIRINENNNLIWERFGADTAYSCDPENFSGEFVRIERCDENVYLIMEKKGGNIINVDPVTGKMNLKICLNQSNTSEIFMRSGSEAFFTVRNNLGIHTINQFDLLRRQVIKSAPFDRDLLERYFIPAGFDSEGNLYGSAASTILCYGTDGNPQWKFSASSPFIDNNGAITLFIPGTNVLRQWDNSGVLADEIKLEMPQEFCDCATNIDLLGKNENGEFIIRFEGNGNVTGGVFGQDGQLSETKQIAGQKSTFRTQRNFRVGIDAAGNCYYVVNSPHGVHVIKTRL